MGKNKLREFLMEPDPFMDLLQEKKPFKIWLYSTIILVVFWLITGGFVELLYLFHPSYANLDFMHLWEPSEYTMALSLYAFFYPLIFVLYKVIPNQIVNVIHDLEAGSILDKDDNGQYLSEILKQSWNKKQIFIVAMICALLFIICYEFFIFSWQASLGMYAYWQNIPWMKVLFYLFYCLMSFSAFILAIRVVMMAAITAKFFRQEHKILDLKPLHPDNCGGMGPLGNLGLRVIGFLVLTYILSLSFGFVMPLASGEETNIVFLYAVLGFYLLAMLILTNQMVIIPHRAMKKFKEDLLLPISSELHDIYNKRNQAEFQKISLDEIDAKIKRAKSLEKLYKIQDRDLPVWPVSLRTYTLTAISPLIASVLVPALGELILVLYGYFISVD